MDLHLIEELIRIVNMSSLSSLEIEEQGLRIRLENQISQAPAPEGQESAAPAPASAPVSSSLLSLSSSSMLLSQSASPQEDPSSDPEENTLYIRSPLVGTYHSTRALGYDPLEPGDVVTPGQAVCAVEAMKLMNVVEAEMPGVIVEFLVEDGALVEYGQKLVRLMKGN